MLSDRDIREYLKLGHIRVENAVPHLGPALPMDDTLIQPASIDVRLSPTFLTFENSRLPLVRAIDLPPDLTQRVDIPPGDDFILHPGDFVLASTIERVTLPDHIAARLEGKSSMGRIGLMIHSTAGYIDPGWTGDITLELSNVARFPIALTPGMKIGQLSFIPLSSPCVRPYGSPDLGSRYQGQAGPTAAKTAPRR